MSVMLPPMVRALKVHTKISCLIASSLGLLALALVVSGFASPVVTRPVAKIPLTSGPGRGEHDILPAVGLVQVWVRVMRVSNAAGMATA